MISSQKLQVGTGLVIYVTSWTWLTSMLQLKGKYYSMHHTLHIDHNQLGNLACTVVAN